MLRVLLLDLDASPTAAPTTSPTGGPPAHLTDALDALPRFRTTDGGLLTWAVVTQDARGLDGSDRSAYRRALEHLGLQVQLEDCVVIAEDGGRLDVCRSLGMTPVQFARTPAAPTPRTATPRFTDWLDGLLLVRSLVAPRHRETAKAALAPWFSARGAHLVSVAEDVDADAATVVLRIPTAAGSDAAPGHTTTTSRVTFDRDGHVLTVTPVSPGVPVGPGTHGGHAAEATVMRASLRDSGALTTADSPVRPGTTHTETIDDTGELVVRRTRFSAI
jgi:hypothetical protein